MTDPTTAAILDALATGHRVSFAPSDADTTVPEPDADRTADVIVSRDVDGRVCGSRFRFDRTVVARTPGALGRIIGRMVAAVEREVST